MVFYDHMTDDRFLASISLKVMKHLNFTLDLDRFSGDPARRPQPGDGRCGHRWYGLALCLAPIEGRTASLLRGGAAAGDGLGVLRKKSVGR